MGLFSKLIDKKKEYDELEKKYNQLEQDYISAQNEYNELNKTVEKLKSQEQEIKKSIDTKSLEYVDQLEGLEFEEYIRKLLIKLGYTNVEKTKASGDFGIDILAEKDNVTYAIQCKLYSNKLGIDCVQEAYSGKKHYDKNIAVVITNSNFTQSAIDLAKDTGVVLWDRQVLDGMLKKVNGTFEAVKEKKTGLDGFDDDPLMNEAIEFAVKTGKVSASLLQRKFRFGYNRAARMIDIMEEKGIIGPQNGSKPRDVLIQLDD